MRSRLYTDQSDRDIDFLIDQTLGHIVLRDAVTDALEYLFEPCTDEDGNSFIYEPLRVPSWDGPEREKTDPMWGDSWCDIQIQYIRLLTQNAKWAQNC